MRNKGVVSVLIILILAVSIVSAGNYSIEFSQIGGEAVVKERINNVKQASYVDENIIDKSGSSYYFVKKLVFPENFDNAKIVLNLDRGVIVSELGIFPTGYEINSDGQTISIVWNLENVKKNQTLALFANLEDTKASYIWMLWILGALILFAVLYIIYRKMPRKERIKIVRVKARTSRAKEERYDKKLEYLLDTEKKVIELLKSADRHELWQKQIQDSTGYSKAKVSRLIRNLEARGLIVKIPFGNTNKVRLK